ncbi:unnamed protein product [Pedinophyceae sp. YPF-701]|nr:unnamed protein product [Pedinophyceae sp. YPF-701]
MSSDAAQAEVEHLRKQVAELQTELKRKEQQLDLVFPYSRSYGRVDIGTITRSPDGGKSLAGRTMRIGGWVKSGREAGGGAFAFLEINDGSTFDNLQAMVSKEVAEAHGGLKALVTTGTSVLVEGELAETPEGKKQAVELKVTKICWLGQCDGATYPIAKKKTSMEFLREKIHLRPRTNMIGAVVRIRNALAWATHSFFQERGFKYIHTPIITCSDCEGAGEMFQVTTLLSKVNELRALPHPSEHELTAKREAVDDQDRIVRTLQESAAGGDKSAKKNVKRAQEALRVAREGLAEMEKAALIEGGLPRTAEGEVDYATDFFARPAFLTVSGQLEGEVYACALSNVYTFGPTFRAENSHTSRHLAEFWMIEPEMAFCNLDDDMDCAEDYVRHCCRYLLEACPNDLQFITQRVDSTAVERLRLVAETPFQRVSYTEAVEILQAAQQGGKKFEFPVGEWGFDMHSCHERYLTEEHFKMPTIVYNYPKDIKAFYMRLNDDNKTVAAMDVLVPKVGELVGGSQREERLDVLTRRIEEAKMPLAQYEQYLDLRRYGSVPHAGFGLGFERLILFATGIENIRDVIPFPRWPGRAT